jgi:hypothetical protein
MKEPDRKPNIFTYINNGVVVAIIVGLLGRIIWLLIFG